MDKPAKLDVFAMRFVRGYTVALFVLAAIFVVSSLAIFSFRDAPTTPPETRWNFTFTGQLELFLAAITSLVATLRVKRSQFAYLATAALSCFLAIFVPIGTGYFLYWLLRVRRLEHAA